MIATVKKVKAAPKLTVNKSRQTPMVAQSRKVTKVAIVAPVELTPGEQVAPLATVAEHVMAMPQVGGANSVDRILLPARMELASVHEAQQLLQSKYPPVHGKYVLDGDLLSVIDMAGIQLLINFIRSVTALGCVVEWDNYSVQVYQLASELGVTSQLGD
jgi:ABC-type transporter Mla MlaB component